MNRAWFLACWAFVGGSVALACGGSSDSGLFGSSGDGTSSTSSGGQTSSSGDVTSGSSGTTSSSGTTTSSSGTTTSSSGTSGTPDSGPPKDAGFDAGKACDRTSLNTGCADGEFCKVTNCATMGFCTKKPTPIPDTGPIICGCDNVTYWNEQLAASFGVSVKGGGACAAGTAKTCSNIVDCPNNRYCNYQTTANGSGICAIVTSGTCWGLPNNCPVVTGGHAKECGSTTCESFCEAVRAEKPWFEEVAAKCQ